MQPDHLEGSEKFFGVLQLTCDSIKITPGSEVRKQVMMVPQGPTALADHGLTRPRSLLSFPLPKGKVSVAFHNVGLHDLGYALNAVHKRWRSLLNRKFLSGSGHRSKEIEILFQWFFQWLALQLCEAVNLWWRCNSAEMSPEEIISFLPFPLVTFQNSKKKKKKKEQL